MAGQRGERHADLWVLPPAGSLAPGSLQLLIVCKNLFRNNLKFMKTKCVSAYRNINRRIRLCMKKLDVSLSSYSIV